MKKKKKKNLIKGKICYFKYQPCGIITTLRSFKLEV